MFVGYLYQHGVSECENKLFENVLVWMYFNHLHVANQHVQKMKPKFTEPATRVKKAWLQLISFDFFFRCRVICVKVRSLWIFLFVRSSYCRCSLKNGVHENFAKFTGKHLCDSLFLNNNFIKKETLAQRVFLEILQSFQEHIFYRTTPGDYFCFVYLNFVCVPLFVKYLSRNIHNGCKLLVGT